MLKYRGFPSRKPGTDHQFKIRRENPKGPTKLVLRERYKDRRETDKDADKVFLNCLLEYFGEEPFERGCLDAGRLSWFLGREIMIISEPFDPYSYNAILKLNISVIRSNFPELLS